MIKRLMEFITGIYLNPWGHVFLLTLYYLVIIAGLILMYGRGEFVPQHFIYQGF